jgi:hypothetical protein
VSKDRRSRRRHRDDRESPAGRRETEEPIALTWRYRLGRLLQFVGLLILPFGIASELVGRVGLGQSLLIAASGALLFYVGFLVQHR